MRLLNDSQAQAFVDVMAALNNVGVDHVNVSFSEAQASMVLGGVLVRAHETHMSEHYASQADFITAYELDR